MFEAELLRLQRPNARGQISLSDTTVDGSWQKSSRRLLWSTAEGLTPGEWIPLAGVGVHCEGTSVEVSWSNCNHQYRYLVDGWWHYDCSYNRSEPNEKVELHFSSQQQASQFGADLHTLPNPWQLGARIPLSGIFEQTSSGQTAISWSALSQMTLDKQLDKQLDLFGHSGKQNVRHVTYMSGSETTHAIYLCGPGADSAHSSWKSTSQLYFLSPNSDIRFEHLSSNEVVVEAVSTVNYISDINGMEWTPEEMSNKKGQFERCEIGKATSVCSFRFEEQDGEAFSGIFPMYEKLEATKKR